MKFFVDFMFAYSYRSHL